MHRANLIHLGLMLAALALTYLLPFELVVLSYVILGPAHYLTEISWLHDRKYFLPHWSIVAVLIVVALAASFVTDAFWAGFLIWCAFILCALIVAAPTALQGMVLFIIAAAFTAVMLSSGPAFAILGILLPTLIHVSLFTLVFMLVGAHRAGNSAQYGLVGVYVGVIALILALPPSAATMIPGFAELAKDYFGNVAQALGHVIGMPNLTLDSRLTGLLSFVYTYHYLNWFIKADVIHWADVPKPRLAVVAIASVVSTGLYFYSPVLGFTLLLALSLTHVLLEFPLNGISLRQLVAIAGQGMTTRVRRKA